MISDSCAKYSWGVGVGFGCMGASRKLRQCFESLSTVHGLFYIQKTKLADVRRNCRATTGTRRCREVERKRAILRGFVLRRKAE